MAESSNHTEDLFESGEPEVPKEEEATQEDEIVEEASLDTDMNATNEDNNSAPQPMNLDGANDMADQSTPVIETRLPAKKDVALREFLSKMDDYAPIVRFTSA